jgi:hypothetical protein
MPARPFYRVLSRYFLGSPSALLSGTAWLWKVTGAVRWYSRLQNRLPLDSHSKFFSTPVGQGTPSTE